MRSKRHTIPRACVVFAAMAWASAGCLYADNPDFLGSRDPVEPADFAMGVGPCAAPSGDQTVLEAAAVGLEPGSWCDLTMGGFTWDLIASAGNTVHISWSSKAVWDPNTRVIRFVGGGENGPGACLVYDERADDWGFCDRPAEIPQTSAYDHNALDPQTGDHYVRGWDTTLYSRWDGTTWRPVPSTPNCDNSAVGMAWDESRQGLVVMDRTQACFYDPTTRQWAVDGQLGATSGSLTQVRYDPRHEATWLQAADAHWVDRAGVVTALGELPISVGCCQSNSAWSNYDFPTGRFVVFNPYNRRWFDYDLAADAWREFENDMPIAYGDGGMGGISVAIPERGVIVYLTGEGAESDPSARVYRHG